MEKETKKIELIAEDGHKIPVKYRVTSAALKVELMDILAEKPDKSKIIIELLMKAFAGNLPEGKTNSELIRQAATEGLVDINEMLKIMQTTPEETQTIDLVTVKCFRAMVDLKQIKTDDKELIESDPGGEFWQSQDLLVMEGEVAEMLGKFRLGK